MLLYNPHVYGLGMRCACSGIPHLCPSGEVLVVASSHPLQLPSSHPKMDQKEPHPEMAARILHIDL